MKESKSNKIRSDGMLILFSILMVLSGMVVTAAAVEPIPNQFYGTVTVDGTDAPAGTNISAYIDGGLKGSVLVETVGKYGYYDLNYLLVEGNAGDEITFTIDGTTADHTPTNVVLLESELPRELDLSTGDPPAVAATDSVIGDRTINPTSLRAGETFRVTVDVTITGTVFGPVLNEDVPAGWTVTPVDNAGATYQADGTKWLWSGGQTGTKTVIYDVTVPTGTANGDYPVTGTVLATVGGSGIGPYSVTGDDGVAVADNTQDTSHDDATGSAPSGSGSDETPKPGPLPDVTMPESEEDASPTPSLTPATTQTTAPPATTIKKPGAEPKEGFIPGFEAAFVIAGLLVVAYLVRRRR